MDKDSSKTMRSRGRPVRSDQDVAKTRQHIADCALRLFQAEGYEAVSMRRLAQEADCTVMTLYRHYDAKIDILRQIWRNVFAELFDQLDARAEGEADPIERLNAVALGYVEFWLAQRDRYFLVFMSSGVSQDDVSVFVADDDLLLRFNVLQDSLAAALDSIGSDADPSLRNQVLMCSLNGIAHNLITISAYPWAEPETLVGEAVSGALHTAS